MNEIEKLEAKIYKNFKECMIFISPFSIREEWLKEIGWINKIFEKKTKKQDKKNLILQFINLISKAEYINQAEEPPLFLELAREKISPLFFDFLLTLHKLHQYRWGKNLKQYSSYALEFFLPESLQTSKNKLKKNIQDQYSFLHSNRSTRIF